MAENHELLPPSQRTLGVLTILAASLVGIAVVLSIGAMLSEKTKS